MVKCVGAIVVLSLLLAYSGCVTLKDPPPIWGAVSQFHSRYSAAEYEGIWTNAGTAFRSSTSKEDSLKLMSAMQGKLGVVKGRVTGTPHISTDKQGTQITIVSRTSFSLGNASVLRRI